jgi:hypothetical protein
MGASQNRSPGAKRDPRGKRYPTKNNSPGDAPGELSFDIKDVSEIRVFGFNVNDLSFLQAKGSSQFQRVKS